MTQTTEPTTALATTEYPKLAELTGFSNGQINLIRQTVAIGAPILTVAWYLYNARRLGLEPMLGQIYLVPFKSKVNDAWITKYEIVVGINGYRKQAEDSGAYAGSDDPVFEYDQVGQPKGAPSKATVTVWKLVQGHRVPFTASARWEEFYPGDGATGAQYRKRPHNQLAIRAESHALRKAFPYQTERLERHDELPDEWRGAATRYEVEQQPTGEQMAALAARYVEIHGEDEGPNVVHAEDRSQAPQERQAGTGATTLPSVPEPVGDELQAALDTNAQMVTLARDSGCRGLGSLTANESWPLDKVLTANDELEQRLKEKNAELDKHAARSAGQTAFES